MRHALFAMVALIAVAAPAQGGDSRFATIEPAGMPVPIPPRLLAYVNGRPITFLVDRQQVGNSLTPEDASRLGVPMTYNAIVGEIRVGNAVLHDVPVAVDDVSMVGRAFMRRLGYVEAGQ